MSQQLTPSEFLGETDSTTGIWKPKKIGAFVMQEITHFILILKIVQMLVKMFRINNNFTVNNLTSIDQSTDTCVVNFATLNSLNVQQTSTNKFSDGNLKYNNKQLNWIINGVVVQHRR